MRIETIFVQNKMWKSEKFEAKRCDAVAVAAALDAVYSYLWFICYHSSFDLSSFRIVNGSKWKS